MSKFAHNPPLRPNKKHDRLAGMANEFWHVAEAPDSSDIERLHRHLINRDEKGVRGLLKEHNVKFPSED